VAKVEQRRGVSEEALREFFREMLLIRRFEEKVRSGSAPANCRGSCTSRSGRRRSLSASAARLPTAT